MKCKCGNLNLEWAAKTKLFGCNVISFAFLTCLKCKDILRIIDAEGIEYILNGQKLLLS